MLSPVKTKTIRLFTYFWVVLFLSSQGVIFAGRSATEIAVTEWNPLSGPIVTPLRSIDVAEGLDKKLGALSLADASEPASSSTTSSTTSISAPSSTSASPERHPSVEEARQPVIPGFRSFLDDLEIVGRLSEHDFVLRDNLRQMIVFHRVFVGMKPKFEHNGPQKRSGIAQEFSRSWIADRLEGRSDLSDILDQVIMDRYRDESSSSEDEESEEPTRHYSCIRTASAVIPQADGPDQVKFYAVYDQLKPGRQEELVSPKLRPDGFTLNEEWDQEISALGYLDYLAACYVGHVVSFSNKGINNMSLAGCLQRLKRIFQVDPNSHYSIDFSHNSLNSHSIRNLGVLLGSSPYLTRVTGIALSHNRFELVAGYLEPLIPLLMQDAFRELDVSGNDIKPENIDTLLDNAKSITQREESEIRQGLSKITL